jgi:alkylation response protein AidB-like acyl-CoA dehydrogenase
MSAAAGAVRWLEPLWSAAELTTGDLARTAEFEGILLDLLAVYPVERDTDPKTRSLHLHQIRQDLATRGSLALAVPARYGGCGRPPVMQAGLQFTCGYHDIDLRDSTSLGHGRLIAGHATPQLRDRWLPQLLAGAVPGIAITEPHGGTQVHATATSARAMPDGNWQVSGTKVGSAA